LLTARLENFDPKNLTVAEVTPASSSLSTAANRLRWWSRTQWHLHLYLAFQWCSRCRWNEARTHLDALLEMPQGADSGSSSHRKRWTTYLTGIIEQGSGNLAAALAAFQDDSLAIQDNCANRNFDCQNDLCLLASLNTLLIIRSPSHPQHYLVEHIMISLEPLTLKHPNKAIVSSIYLLKSVFDNSVTGKKQNLQIALNNARAMGNSQLLAVGMNAMTSMFFKDIVGEQADKSTATARVLAQRAENSLWEAVANGMMANTMDRQGKGQLAEKTRRDAEQLVEKLPEGVRNSFLNE
jgi:hypothetical protein